MAKKLTETLAAPIKACLLNTTVNDPSGIVERLAASKEMNTVMGILDYPEPVMEHINARQSLLKYVWEEMTLTFIIEWEKTSTGRYKVVSMQHTTE